MKIGAPILKRRPQLLTVLTDDPLIKMKMSPILKCGAQLLAVLKSKLQTPGAFLDLSAHRIHGIQIREWKEWKGWATEICA